MTKVAVYSAIFGDYDKLHAQLSEQTVPIDFHMFSDCFWQGTAPWRMHHVTGLPEDLHPRRKAKLFKMTPHKLARLAGYGFTLWIDGGISIIHPNFVERAITAAELSGIALYRHPVRDCIYAEADFLPGHSQVSQRTYRRAGRGLSPGAAPIPRSSI